MELLNSFSEDLPLIKSIESSISTTEAYLLGYSRAIYNQDINQSIDFFNKLNIYKGSDFLTEHAELFLLYKFYSGCLHEAELLLSLLIEVNASHMLRHLICEDDQQTYKKIKSIFKYNALDDLPQEPAIREPIDCPICLEEIPDEESIPLEQCGHNFHQLCMYKYLETKVEARQFPILCPLDTCKIEIDMYDLKERLGPYLYQLYEDYTFKEYVQNHQDECTCCPTADCTYVFIPDSNTEFSCPVCTKHYCLRCRCIFHQNLTCEEYIAANGNVEDAQFLKFVRGAKFKQCPQCRFWVEKNQGCDHMTCRCGFQFCYVCGGVYRKCACG
ncbi:unnamed protein product [Blepharisma stoltei]|uniref:RBR-type E3 ubiquitin transferase n=1 Tax=Blepharisma stoltei TaxID=1481888 RepID=A0AAU9IQ92_9CILI|nr:unnamed protein product [Blepharisma stoltei]